MIKGCAQLTPEITTQIMRMQEHRRGLLLTKEEFSLGVEKFVPAQHSRHILPLMGTILTRIHPIICIIHDIQGPNYLNLGHGPPSLFAENSKGIRRKIPQKETTKVYVDAF